MPITVNNTQLQHISSGVKGTADTAWLEMMKNMGLDALSAARDIPISSVVIDSERFEDINYYLSTNTIYKSGNQNGGPALQQESYTIVNHDGRDFFLYDQDTSKYLNDTNVRVSDTGYLLKYESGFNTIGGKIQILGKAVDAPEYVPPKYTADFFDASSDFIMRAAQEYARTGADETLDTPYYSSDKFISSMLDFFSSGKATQADIEITKASIESIIKELAEMLQNGDEANYSKLQSKVNIMGEQVSLTQLLEMQSYGKELSNQLTGENKEWLGFGSDRVGEFARRGLIRSMGMSYGDQIGGAVGEMFKSAWGAEVDRHSEIIRNRLDSLIRDEGIAISIDILKNGAQYIYEVFSKVDTSSKENALESYKALSGEIDAAINKFLDQYTGGVPGGLAVKMRAEVDSYFYDLMGFKSVDVLV